MPTLLAQLSDPHIRLGPDSAPAADALARAVREVQALRTPPDAVIVTGDLTDTGDPAEYAWVRELLAPLDVPVHAIPGNHDEAEPFAAAFGPPQWVTTIGGLRLVGCDSTVPGRPDGALDVDWLEARLAEDTVAPTIVALHHPPMDIGLHALDEIGLAPGDRDRLAALLARTPNVRRTIAGHVHRGAFGTLGGCGVLACPSTHAQARLEIGSTAFDFAPDEAPAFALHVLLDSGELVSHLQPIGR